jgi:hypothetical protein
MKRKVLVSMAERLEIQASMSKQMGTNVIYTVIDLDKVVKKIQAERKDRNLTPFIEIRPVSEDVFKVPMRLNTFQKDPITGVLYGIPSNVDQHGNIKWQKIQLNDNLTLNLNNVNDAKIWAVIRFHPDIKYSPFQSDTPYYEIYDPVDKSIADELRVEKMREAFSLVDKIVEDPLQMVMFARYLGAELHEQSNYQIVKGELLRYAETSPGIFVEKYKSRSRKFEEIFSSAEALAIVTENPNSGYMYGNLPLGLTREEAVLAIQKDGNVTTSILTEIEKKDETAKVVSVTIPKKEPVKKEPAAKVKDKEFE